MICLVSSTSIPVYDETDVLEEAENMIEMEKGWLLSK